jgi:hypothetical protein
MSNKDIFEQEFENAGPRAMQEMRQITSDAAAHEREFHARIGQVAARVPVKFFQLMWRFARNTLFIYFCPLLGGLLSAGVYFAAHGIQGGQNFFSFGLGGCTFIGLLYLIALVLCVGGLGAMVVGVFSIHWIGRALVVFYFVNLGLWWYHGFDREWLPTGAWFFCVVLTILTELIHAAWRRFSATD